MSKPVVIILLGPPGSGKGTQAKRLAKQYNLPHISTGDLFRDNMSTGTPLGKKAQGFIQGGQLVPDSLVLDMLFDRIGKTDCLNGFILDGFPRTLPQAEALSERLEELVQFIVLSLDVRDEVIIDRAEGRLTCKQCGAIYHRDNAPPKAAGKCDKCGGEVIRRPDDEPQVVKERLRVYHAQTKPLIRYYDDKELLNTFDGTQSPDTVFAALTATIP